MTQEEVYNWLIKVMIACVWMMALFASILIVGGAAGYISERYVVEIRERCINSACDAPCSQQKHFVRHAGECVK